MQDYYRNFTNTNSDGRIVISSRKNNIPKDENGRIILAARANAITVPEEGIIPFEPKPVIDWTAPDNSSPAKSEKKPKKKKDKKKKKKKHNKKLKKQKSSSSISFVPHDKKKSKYLQTLVDSNISEKKPLLPSTLAALAAERNTIAVDDGRMYIYDEELGYFVPADKKTACIKISELISDTQRLSVSHREIMDAYQAMLIYPELQRQLSNSWDTSYINCMNGVYDVEHDKLLPHSPDYEFTNYIHANYDPKCKGEAFSKFLKDAFGNHEDRVELLQEVMGYLFSSYTVVKKAFWVYGGPGTGKSVLLNVIREIRGGEYVCAVDLQRLSEPSYAARIGDNLINIAPDMPNDPVKDIGTFKSMVSSTDAVEVRRLYENPKTQLCKCKFLFASNSLVPLNNFDAYNLKAFFDRLLFISMNKTRSEEEFDRELPKKLLAERDYIFTWAMAGLRRLKDNNFVFTKCKKSERILEDYKSRYSPMACFFNEYVELDPDSVVGATQLQEMYEAYARERDIKPKQNAVRNFIESSDYDIKPCRKRIGGSKNALHAYQGIRLKEA